MYPSSGRVIFDRKTSSLSSRPHTPTSHTSHLCPPPPSHARTHTMSDFKAGPLFNQIREGLDGMNDKEKKDIQKKVSARAIGRTTHAHLLCAQTNGVFEMHIKNSGGKELVYTIDLKKVCRCGWMPCVRPLIPPCFLFPRTPLPTRAPSSRAPRPTSPSTRPTTSLST